MERPESRIGMFSARDYFVGNFLFPVSNYFYNRRAILKHYKYFCASDGYSEEELHDIQLGRLKNLVKYTNEYIPYYRELYKNLGLKYQDIRDLKDISHIPPLTRQDVISRYKDMVDSRYQSSIRVAEMSKRGSGEPIPFARFKKHNLVRNTSSGSTGAPTVFFEDGSRTALNWAHELRLKHWYGLEPGVKEARMARLSTIYLKKSKSLEFRKFLWNQQILPGTNLSEEDFDYCVRSIAKFQPEVLWGYTSALTGLANYIKKNLRSDLPVKLRLAIAWAAPLYEQEKRIISEVFQCPVTNIYGARETGHVAATCPEGAFHVNQEYLYVENQALPDDVGNTNNEFLVTTLDLSPMPFIRYRMGDVGEVDRSSCSCGRKLQILKNLVGRTGEIFITKDGRMISPNFWCRVFMSEKHADDIKRFQIKYTKDKDIKIYIERSKSYTEETENYIHNLLSKNFSADTKTEIIYVQIIESQISGKYQMVSKEN
jgi:phenylacetate-CoA ligase